MLKSLNQVTKTFSSPHFSQATIPSPLGKLSAIASKHGLWALTFPEELPAIKAKLTKCYPDGKFGSYCQGTIDETEAWLQHYFAKDFSKLKLPAIDWQGSTFAITAWKKLLKVPVGKTQTYGELAKKVGNEKASRAIGRVMGQNPIVIIVPCHRIIGTNQTLTGYGGGIDRKIWLLKHEGHTINQ